MSTHDQRKSRKQEKVAAEDLGGRVQPGSGAPQFYKGDVRVAGEVRLEAKTTSKKSFSLKLSELQKIQTEALRGGLESPVLQVEFQGVVGNNKKYAVIPWLDYLELRNRPMSDRVGRFETVTEKEFPNEWGVKAADE